MQTPILYSFSGLPGAGKTTLAQRLSAELQACYVRIDTIEQSMKEFSDFEVQGEGYQLSYRIASDNLKLGVSVVADSCNPIELTRREWMQVALQEGAKTINIEVSCSDQAEHQQRIESRVSTVPGLQLPNWNDVVSREYEPWVEPRLVIDTANSTIEKSFGDLLQQLNALHANVLSE